MFRLIGLLLQGVGGIILLGLFALNFVAGAQVFGLQFLPEAFSEPPWSFLIADLSAPLFFLPVVMVPTVLMVVGEALQK